MRYNRDGIARDMTIDRAINSTRAACCECGWANGLHVPPVEGAQAHVRAFGHDVAVTTVQLSIIREHEPAAATS